MKKEMQHISVATNDSGNIVISQEWNDINEPDPQITISPDQAPLVASWIYQASQHASPDLESKDEVPVRFYARGPEAEAENLTVYNNRAGMIILKIDDDAFFEIAPAMAKRLRDLLSKAIRSSLTDLLRPDSDA
ncbi:MAG: hypothetical protein EOO15_21995 [Chitinophagaceae bacterium]|nr:MAG: hypothetical protein EOO15_21995 [Chitinophagaceae bacterium]